MADRELSPEETEALGLPKPKERPLSDAEVQSLGLPAPAQQTGNEPIDLSKPAPSDYVSPGRAAVVGFAQGGTKGGSDELGGAIANATEQGTRARIPTQDYSPDDSPQVLQAKLEANDLSGATAKAPSLGERVTQKMRAEQEAAHRYQPLTAGAGQMAGEVASDAAIGLGANINPASLEYQGLSGAASGYGNATKDQGLEGAATGLASGIGGYAGGKAVGLIGKGASKVANWGIQAGLDPIRNDVDKSVFNKLLTGVEKENAGQQKAYSGAVDEAAKVAGSAEEANKSTLAKYLAEVEKENAGRQTAYVSTADNAAKVSSAANEANKAAVAKHLAEVEKESAGQQKAYVSTADNAAEVSSAANKANRAAQADVGKAKRAAFKAAGGEVAAENNAGFRERQNYDDALAARAKAIITGGMKDAADKPTKLANQITAIEAEIEAEKRAVNGRIGGLYNAEGDNHSLNRLEIEKALTEPGHQTLTAAGFTPDEIKKGADYIEQNIVPRKGTNAFRRILTNANTPIPEQAQAASAKKIAQLEADKQTLLAAAASPPSRKPEDIATEFPLPDLGPAMKILVPRLEADDLAAGIRVPSKTALFSPAERGAEANKRASMEWIKNKHPELFERMTNPAPMQTPGPYPLPKPPEDLTPEKAQQLAASRAPMQTPGPYPLPQPPESLAPEQAQRIAAARAPMQTPGPYPLPKPPGELTPLQARQMAAARVNAEELARKNPALGRKINNPALAYQPGTGPTDPTRGLPEKDLNKALPILPTGKTVSDYFKPSTYLGTQLAYRPLQATRAVGNALGKYAPLVGGAVGRTEAGIDEQKPETIDRWKVFEAALKAKNRAHPSS